MFSAVRPITLPVTLITLSSRADSAIANAGELGVSTHCVRP